jgi:hypothetical protein
VAYVRTETFFDTGDLGTAARNLLLVADHVLTKVMAEVPAAATYGSLHMRAAVVAARAEKSGQALDHLSEARLVAARVPEGMCYAAASKGTWPLRRSDRVRIETLGGGGWGKENH